MRVWAVRAPEDTVKPWRSNAPTLELFSPEAGPSRTRSSQIHGHEASKVDSLKPGDYPHTLHLNVHDGFGFRARRHKQAHHEIEVLALSQRLGRQPERVLRVDVRARVQEQPAFGFRV